VSFSKVALYFENSLEKQDLALLPAAATSTHVEQETNGAMNVDSADCSRVAWRGPVAMDGKTWPVQNDLSVIMPIGKHRLTASTQVATVELSDFNGELRTALVSTDKTDVS